MARITVEDCLGKIKNRFNLVLSAAKRARKLASGSAEPSVTWSGDKSTVVALREAAAGNLNPEGEVASEEKNISEPETILSVTSTLEDLVDNKEPESGEEGNI